MWRGRDSDCLTAFDQEAAMAGNYYVNDTAQPNSDHEVHVEGCYWLSLARSTTALGYHVSCSSAVVAARRYYFRSNGCATCSAACHTS